MEVFVPELIASGGYIISDAKVRKTIKIQTN
jgi:hypothetical protein